MTQTLIEEAAEIYFSRHSNPDQDTMMEIEKDLQKFLAKVERADTTQSIKAQLKKTATK